MAGTIIVDRIESDASWTLDDETCLWQAPVPMPDDGKNYEWIESTTSWLEVE